jgi:hypothetical protein
MTKKRRIEITAFRRTLTVSASGHPAGPQQEAPQSLDSRPGSADDPLAQPKQADLAEAVLSSIDTESSTDLEHLIEVVADHDDGVPRNRSG